MDKDISSLPVGTVLKGKYRIVSRLSSGGFGKTYLAVYGSHDTKVAIKKFFMNTANLRESDGVSVSVDRTKENANAFKSQLSKFKKEYERLRLISNVHVVTVCDCFEENGTAYYVMEYVDGDDLKGRLQQRRIPYSEKTVRNYLRQILDGLSAIHSVGLLHLDIKPANIMVTARGYVKLIDLGSSKDYMGPWTDFYALGATIYYLLTCNEIPTWTALNEDKTRDKHIALPMPGVSDEMRCLVAWLMNTDREKRPHSVDEILTRTESKKWTGSSYDDTTVLAGDTEDATIFVENHKIQYQSNVSQKGESYRLPNDRNSTPRQNPTQEKEPEFSFVGCLYILIFIAIVVFVVKFLFMT